MRITVGFLALALSAALAGTSAAQSPSVPTPATPGPNPGAAATDAITAPSRPPAEVAPPAGSASPPPTTPAEPAPSMTRPPAEGRTPPSQVQYSPPPVVEPAAAQPQGALTPGEIRELLDASAATAKATREAVDYSRVVPDILTQILTKLDKIEDKLGRMQDEIQMRPPPRRR